MMLDRTELNIRNHNQMYIEIMEGGIVSPRCPSSHTNILPSIQGTLQSVRRRGNIKVGMRRMQVPQYKLSETQKRHIYPVTTTYLHETP